MRGPPVAAAASFPLPPDDNSLFLPTAARLPTVQMSPAAPTSAPAVAAGTINTGGRAPVLMPPEQAAATAARAATQLFKQATSAYVNRRTTVQDLVRRSGLHAMSQETLQERRLEIEVMREYIDEVGRTATKHPLHRFASIVAANAPSFVSIDALFATPLSEKLGVVSLYDNISKHTSATSVLRSQGLATAVRDLETRLAARLKRVEAEKIASLLAAPLRSLNVYVGNQLFEFPLSDSAEAREAKLATLKTKLSASADLSKAASSLLNSTLRAVAFSTNGELAAHFGDESAIDPFSEPGGGFDSDNDTHTASNLAVSNALAETTNALQQTVAELQSAVARTPPKADARFDLKMQLSRAKSAEALGHQLAHIFRASNAPDSPAAAPTSGRASFDFSLDPTKVDAEDVRLLIEDERLARQAEIEARIEQQAATAARIDREVVEERNTYLKHVSSIAHAASTLRNPVPSTVLYGAMRTAVARLANVCSSFEDLAETGAMDALWACKNQVVVTHFAEVTAAAIAEPRTLTRYQSRAAMRTEAERAQLALVWFRDHASYDRGARRVRVTSDSRSASAGRRATAAARMHSFRSVLSRSRSTRALLSHPFARL